MFFLTQILLIIYFQRLCPSAPVSNFIYFQDISENIRGSDYQREEYQSIR